MSMIIRRVRRGGSLLLKEGGSLHPGVINPKGVTLSAGQIWRLRGMLTNTRVTSKRCHNPHHGLVFYDPDGKALGCVNFCFGCNTATGFYLGEGVYWDWKSLRSLFKELKLPVLGHGEGSYTQLFEEGKKERSKKE